MSGGGREKERERERERGDVVLGTPDRIKRVLRRSICYSGSWIDGSFAGKKKFHRVASSERVFFFFFIFTTTTGKELKIYDYHYEISPL